MVDMSRNHALSQTYSNVAYGTKPEQPSFDPLHDGGREPLRIAYRRIAASLPAGVVDVSPRHANASQWNTERIAIKANGRIFLVDPTEILAAEAQGNYVLVQRRTASHLLRERISVLAEKLKAFGLIRIHRSVLVNGAHVEGVKPLPTGEYLLRMRGGKEYNVSRTYKSNLQFLAATWIGTDAFHEENGFSDVNQSAGSGSASSRLQRPRSDD